MLSHTKYIIILIENILNIIIIIENINTHNFCVCWRFFSEMFILRYFKPIRYKRDFYDFLNFSEMVF